MKLHLGRCELGSCQAASFKRCFKCLVVRPERGWVLAYRPNRAINVPRLQHLCDLVKPGSISHFLYGLEECLLKLRVPMLQKLVPTVGSHQCTDTRSNSEKSITTQSPFGNGATAQTQSSTSSVSFPSASSMIEK